MGRSQGTPDLQQRPDGQRWPETVLVPQPAEVADLMAWIGREIEIPGGRDDPAKALKLYTAGRAGSLESASSDPTSTPRARPRFPPRPTASPGSTTTPRTPVPGRHLPQLGQGLLQPVGQRLLDGPFGGPIGCELPN
jgi:hypothetical protein